jgi:YidC/Oxa1 family membrane protein insertase
MEKRGLLAAVLSGIIVILWFALVAPPRPAESPAAVGGAIPSPRAVGVAETPIPPPAETPVTASGPVRAPLVGTDASEVTITGVGLRAVVSPRGGTLRSLVLADYRDEAGAPLELVRAGGAAPLTLGEPGPWNEELYQVVREGGAVRLSWSDGKGSWVEKRILAGEGKFALEVEVRSSGTAGRGGVVVATGVERGGGALATGRFAGSDAVVRLNGKLERISATKLPAGQRLRGAVDFAGVEDQYFLLALLPSSGIDEVRLQGVPGKTSALPEVALVGVDGVVRGTLYAGAKEHRTLSGYGRGLEDTVSFGLFGFLSVGFLAALRWIESWVANWGMAIIVLTAGIRVLLFPLNHKSTVAMRRMQALQPKLKAIQDRYQEKAKKDPTVRARMNQEVMQMYKQEGVNPMGGCLPMLVQLPILWALYSLFAYAIELRQAPFALWIRDLSIPDTLFIIPLSGFSLPVRPLALLMGGSMFLQQRLAPQVGDPAQRRMFMMMPFLFTFMFYGFASGLTLYWLVNNLFTIGQQLLTERMLARSAQSA